MVKVEWFYYFPVEHGIPVSFAAKCHSTSVITSLDADGIKYAECIDNVVEGDSYGRWFNGGSTGWYTSKFWVFMLSQQLTRQPRSQDEGLM